MKQLLRELQVAQSRHPQALLIHLSRKLRLEILDIIPLVRCIFFGEPIQINDALVLSSDGVVISREPLSPKLFKVRLFFFQISSPCIRQKHLGLQPDLVHARPLVDTEPAVKQLHPVRIVRYRERVR